MKYFILKPRAKTKDDKFAQASQEAMLKFAEFIESIDPKLAKGLNAWALKESIQQTRL